LGNVVADEVGAMQFRGDLTKTVMFVSVQGYLTLPTLPPLLASPMFLPCLCTALLLP
jgi:hypothetical protein